MDEALLAMVAFGLVERAAELEQGREVGMFVRMALYRDLGEGPGGSAGMRRRASGWKLWQEPRWSVRWESGYSGELRWPTPEQEKRQMLEGRRTYQTLEERR